MLARLRTAAFNLAFYGVTLPMVLLAIVALALPRRALIAVATAWSAWHRLCVRGLLDICVVVEGDRPAGPVLYAMKHESFFEALDSTVFSGGPIIPFAKSELLRIPLWGWAAARYGVIGVERSRGAKALRDMARRAGIARASGRDFLIFPEGTRVPHGQDRRLQSGLYGIYKLLDLPVVPVAVNSGPLYQASPKRSGTITYRIGETIPPGLPRPALEARVHAAINALNEPANAPLQA